MNATGLVDQLGLESIMAPIADETDDMLPRQALLWIDTVGVYLLCFEPMVTFGGPPAGSAEVTIMANLSRRHFTITRNGDGYVLEPHGPVTVDNRELDGPVDLSTDRAISCGRANSSPVKLKFSQPTSLSNSARLNITSDHQTPRRVDGIVLFAETCLLGPGADNHIVCKGWDDSVVLFRRNDQIHVKSRSPLVINDEQLSRDRAYQFGEVVCGPEIRFRLEAI
ncbi:hypothetical protein V22_05760 [Calycomorphotria hydatis]|uniref:FHA domain-containing protein n=2 Tax=Calycomorphotria hydatis TaxID=2528027 RepID=A0A517T4Q5_9PLAN|nr:hypothetical protein V22_05760 [Calycomorphotria hydatis]